MKRTVLAFPACFALASFFLTGPAHAVKLSPITSVGADDHPFPIGTIDRRLVYGATHAGVAPSVHVTDGVKDDVLASVGTQYSSFDATNGKGIVGGRFLFGGGGDLWATGGTAVTTIKLGAPTPFVPEDTFATVAPGLALFTRATGAGRAIWSTDGTPAGTKLVRNVATHTDSYAPAFMQLGSITIYTVYGYGYGTTAADGGIWKWDGTTSTLIRGGRYIQRAFKCGSYAYFRAGDSGGSVDFTPGWWRTDGTLAGTLLVGEQTETTHAACLNGTMLFSEIGKPLRASTGGPAIELGDATKLIYSGIAVAGTQAFFAATAPVGSTTQSVLYRTDGTLAGTIELPVSGSNVFFGPTVGDNVIAVVDQKIVFSDGTAAGTVVSTIDVDPSFVYTRQSYSGPQYFWGKDAAHGAEPWVTDGTAAGTHMVDDVAPGPASSLDESRRSDYGFYLADGQLFTLGNDGTHGVQVIAGRVAPSKYGADAGAHSDAGPGGDSGPSSSGSDAGGTSGDSTAPDGANGLSDGSGGGCGCRAASGGSSGLGYAMISLLTGALAMVRRRRA